eukprot:TCONS_00048365-protein
MLRVLVTITFLGAVSAAVLTKIANWVNTFDRGGWSNCTDGYFLTGLYRDARGKIGDERIGKIKQGDCKSADIELTAGCQHMDCYNLNIWDIFDKKGWVSCKPGYFIQSIYSTKGEKLSNIEEVHCCKPKSKNVVQGKCYNHNIWFSFDHKGWSRCNPGYYIQGMFRSDCNQLYCLEEFKCCEMKAVSKKVSTKIVNWRYPFGFQPSWWSRCPDEYYLTGLWRSAFTPGGERIGKIQQGHCQSAPENLESKQECKSKDITYIFDKEGWAQCDSGYYIKLIRTSRGIDLRNIEEFYCCRPRGKVTEDGDCYVQNV